MFGCNALYRSFERPYELPDWLIAIDYKMAMEIYNSHFPNKRFIFPSVVDQHEPIEMHPHAAMPPRSNAGMVAMREAIKRDHNQLYCVGFDFLIVDDKQATSNIYDGSECYGSDTRATLYDTRNRFKYLIWLLEKHKEIEFIFAFPGHMKVYVPEVSNFKAMSFDEMLAER